MTARGPVDRAAAARAIEDFLRALGLSLTGELAETGSRVAEAWDAELLAGEGVDLAAEVRRAAIPVSGESPGLVGVRGIDVTLMCPHHLLPSAGTADVAFLANRQLAGLGAIASLAERAARRLVLQETLGTDIVAAITTGLEAHGAICRLSLVHACLSSRGERQAHARVETITTSGALAPGASHHGLALAWIGANG